MRDAATKGIYFSVKASPRTCGRKHDAGTLVSAIHVFRAKRTQVQHVPQWERPGRCIGSARVRTGDQQQLAG